MLRCPWRANVYGYIRVSSRDQNEDRQMIALKEIGIAEGNIYLEKQDYIRMKQLEQIEEQADTIQKQKNLIFVGKQDLVQQREMLHRQGELIEEQEQMIGNLEMKISDLEELIDEVADIAYDKAVETITDEVVVQTHKEDIALVEGSKRWVQAPERKASKKEKDYALARLDGVIRKIERSMSSVVERIKARLSNPEVKAKAIEQIKKTARPSIMERIQKNKVKVADQEAERRRKIQQNMEL